MKLDKEQLKIAEVYWVDSISGSGWVLADDYKDDKPLGCYSIGILIDANENGITIAQNVGFEPEQFCNTITIPKCAIKSMKIQCKQEVFLRMK